MRADDDRGAQALEFALITPMLLMASVAIVLGGALGAAMLSTQHQATQLARLAAVADDFTVQQAVVGHSARVQVHPAGPVRRPGQLVTVTLTQDMHLGGLTLPISATASAQVEDLP